MGIPSERCGVMLWPRTGGPVLACGSPSSTCGQAAPALAIAMTLAKVSRAQWAAGTSVPCVQHVGDCIFSRRAQSIWETPGYQHAVLEGECVEVRVTLPDSSREVLHKVALCS